jgi:DNA-binding NarL/FixJ family response regulator
VTTALDISSVHLATLSRREQQVLALIRAGRKRSQIAAILGVSAGTVDIYCNRVMIKLDIYDVARLADIRLEP